MAVGTIKDLLADRPLDLERVDPVLDKAFQSAPAGRFINPHRDT